MGKQYVIWNLLFAIGEWQLSKLIWPESDSKMSEQIPEDIKVGPSKATKIEEIRKFKMAFDAMKKDFYNEIKEHTNREEGVVIWKPVFDWIINQCPNIYTFDNIGINQGYLQSYSNGEEYISQYINGYGKKLHHNPVDNLNKYFERMVKKTNRLMYLGVLILSLFTVLVGLGNIYFPDNLWLFSPLMISIGYFSWLVIYKKKVLHPSNFKVPNSTTTLLSLFTDKKTLSYQEVQKNKENSLLLKIEIFKDHDDWVDYLSKVGNLEPVLYQHADYIQIEQQIGNGDTFLKLVSKSASKNPLEVYFRDEAAMVIREEFRQHNLVEEILSSIDFSTLDIPMIIQEYLESKKNV